MAYLFLLFGCALSEYVEFTVTDEITWGWEYLENSIIRFTMKCKGDGYCSIGLGNNRMYPTDMFAVTPNGNSAEVGDYWASAYGAPVADTSRSGGVEDYTLISGNYASDLMTAVFDRQLDTGDKWDWEIVKGEKINYIWAWHGSDGDYETFHTKYGTGSVTLADTQIASVLDSTDSDDSEDEFERHGQAMTLVWFVVAHIGIIAARYFKFTFLWYLVHVGAFGAATVLTLYSTFAAYDENEASNLAYTDDNKIYHSRIGFGIAAVIIGQSLMGMLTFFNTLCNKKNVHIASTLRDSHKILGWALAVLACVQIYYGWDIFDDAYDDDRRNTAYMGYVILIALYTFLELNHQLGARYLPHPFNECRRCRLPEMSHAEAMKLIKSGRKLVFFDDLVLDVSTYRFSHPGGAVMFNKSIGQDVGKYLNGCSSIGGKFNPWNHSPQAFRIARQLAIAKLPSKYYIGPISDGKIGPSDNSNTFGDMSGRIETEEAASPSGVPNETFMLSEGYWEFVDKKLVAQNTYDFTLKSDDVQVPASMNGLETMGQHFSVSYGGITRYYSFTLALSPYHEQALKSSSRDFAEPSDLKSEQLHLYIKVYPQGGLTQKLLNLQVGSSICLKGPMGPGLMLTPETTGRCVAFGGGTGVIPFLDLVELLYWQKLRPRQSTCKLDGLKLTLFVSFRAREDVVGEQLLQATAELYGSDDTFQLMNSLDSSTGRVNQALVNRLVSAETTYVWICGPSGFNAVVRDMAEEAGARSDAIIVM